ncbi:uncharacterized protein IUM83_10997 [Phytophthora cinnamomi]|uniref:uncharacterized protein n=1 Tax=Phytophthora cinnamomi TaxID=4785 RepID=UPI00355A302C|nr:hypothetical protein IUM83_10997 [Phytophthora cinnamomi]
MPLHMRLYVSESKGYPLLVPESSLLPAPTPSDTLSKPEYYCEFFSKLVGAHYDATAPNEDQTHGPRADPGRGPCLLRTLFQLDKLRKAESGSRRRVNALKKRPDGLRHVDDDPFAEEYPRD